MPALLRHKDRRRSQAGTTLVELLVSLVIMGMALVLVVGTFSTGLLDATIAKRNTAVEAVVQYEMDKIGAAAFASPANYSECFATDNTNAPAPAPCPATFTLRADVTWTPRTSSTQLWTVKVVALPAGTQVVGGPISLIKVNR
jgi:type II secretory pathway pseudopilin PulG